MTKGNRDNQIVLEIRNASPVPRELMRSTLVGVFEEVREMDLIPLDSFQGVPEDGTVTDSNVNAVSTQRQCYDDLRRRQQLPQTGRKAPGVGPTNETYEVKWFIEDKVVLNCNKDERASYLNLFYRNSQVFSRSKNDLGTGCGKNNATKVRKK